MVAALALELRDRDGQRVETGQILVYDIVAVVPEVRGLLADLPPDGEPGSVSRYLVCAMDPGSE